MSLDKLTGEEKSYPKIGVPAGKSNLELYREMANQRKKDLAIVKLIQEEIFPQAVLDVYFQRFLS